MTSGPLGAWSLAAAALALAGVAGAWAVGGGAMFSPGDLRAGDSTATRLGGVTSHAAVGGRCGACHAAPWSGETMDARCLACHTDIRADRRDSATLHGRLGDAGTCVDCHTEHAGARGVLTRLDRAGRAHDRLGFALRAHGETADGRPFGCRDCHDAGDWRFDRARCASCHRDYQRALMVRHEAAWGSDCLACHDGTDRFSRGAFDHGRTTFPLTGKHRGASCEACHARARSLADLRSAPTACIGCHRADDRHRGELGADCAGCHSTETWTGARFDHAAFPIDHGGRGRTACRTCHPDSTNYRTYTCYGCHEHSPARVQAQHREEAAGRALDDCLRCHAGGRREEGEHEGRREHREHEGRRERREH